LPIGCRKLRKNALKPSNACGENAMEAQKDFKELLALFNAHDVDYVIVGAYALAFHGAPRYTGDLDVLVRPDRENGERVLNALNAFGFASLGLTEEDFSSPNKVVQLGYPPSRIDILTSLTGVSWDQVAAGRIKSVYGDVEVNYLGKNELVQNKRALGRMKDLADIEAIGEK
jgi:hypothetical protein